MCNVPSNDTIYLLDNLGYSNVCGKQGNKYVCADIMYGKNPVLNLDKCAWELCDINSQDNTVDFNTCKETSYPYYVEKSGNGCTLKRLDDSKFNKTTKLDCCCNPESICDYTNCCDKIASKDCDYSKGFQGNFFNESYFIKPGEFTCVQLQCAQIPPDYKGNEDRYPQFKEAIKRRGIFHSNICNCVKDEESCKANNDCQPTPGCNPCIIGAQGGYSCIINNNGEYTCVTDPQGNYVSERDCTNDCKPSKRYSCEGSLCKEDEEGPYYSQEECQKTCVPLKITDYDDFRSQLSRLLPAFGLMVAIVVLMAILFYVFILVRNRLKK